MGPNTRNTLAPKTGWGTSGNLTTGNTTQVVTMQADFPETGTYTVEFSLTANSNSNNPIVAEALITWVIEGNFVTRRVNVADGMSISGVGQGLRVVMNDATRAFLNPMNNVSYGVACQVARGVRGTSKQPPTLVGQTLLAGSPVPAEYGAGVFLVGAGSLVDVMIPADAGATSVLVTAIDQTTATNVAGKCKINQAYVLAGTVFVAKSYDSFEYNDWIPLTPGVNIIQVANSSADMYVVSVTFGIDG